MQRYTQRGNYLEVLCVCIQTHKMEAHDTTTVETKNSWHVVTSDRIITGMMYFCRLLVLVVGRQTSI